MSFRDIALPLAARGIPVIPVQPREKRCILPAWQERASTNVDQIEAWNRENNEFNVGCVGKFDGVAIFDCDVKGLVSRIEKETSQKFPATFVVRSAGRGCAHVYFRHTERSRRLGNRATKDLFDLKAHNAYVVGPGSKLGVNGSTTTYDVFRDAPFADFPDWLAEWIEANSVPEKPRSAARNTAKTADDFDIHAFLDHYKLTYDMRGNWYVTEICPIAKHRHEQSTETGFYFDGEKFGFHCFAAGCAGSAMSVGQVIAFLNKEHTPYPGVIWEGPPAYSDGLIVFEREEDYEKHMAQKNAMAAELVESIETVDATPMPPYPNVWKGTLYDEFADVCQRGNKIPREFFLESIKTVMGSLMGSNIGVQGEHGLITGAKPRFYTVLVARGQGGKGTAIDWTLRVFEHPGDGGTLVSSSPLWWGSIDPATSTWKRCGACHSTFNSVPGLGKLDKQPRLLQTYGELSTLINNTGMDASGEGLLAVLRDLYDDTRYHIGATARRAPVSGSIEHSLLAGTTPELWGSMFAKKQVEGSGLFQRFNIIPADKVERVTLYDPKLEGISRQFFAVLELLDTMPVTLHISRQAIARLDEWFNPIANNPDYVDDDYGRLNVLALRNALHLAFVRDTHEIGMREIDDAIRLSDYQLAVRLRYKPASGYNDYALIEDEVRKIVRAERKVTLREIKRKLRKYGSRGVEMAIGNLGDEVQQVETMPEGGGTKTMWLLWRVNY